ncbi:hypothetical protein CEXT_555911 [Caerostris extrusa]|uniref:Ycf15 n=1 Tax=Caerostris extrusa TaxID=172846 RepID=A0AAV4NB84_CAEEX|nr:hypothetical protein CEXT_555911 [Caerostris extrusa]
MRLVELWGKKVLRHHWSLTDSFRKSSMNDRVVQDLFLPSDPWNFPKFGESFVRGEYIIILFPECLRNGKCAS